MAADCVKVWGFVSLTPPHLPGGNTMIRALPMMSDTGTAPLTPPPPWNRESSELLRLSPITHTSPSGTFTGSNDDCCWLVGSSQWM